MTDITYVGHSSIYIESDNCGIITDPFISANPNTDFDYKNKNITDVFLTHAHADHVGDAIEISRKKEAPITAIFELANICAEKGATVDGVNFGGKLIHEWGYAKFLPAFHSSSTPDGRYAGMPASILFEINGKKLYHAGDTCLNQEMKTVGEFWAPDIAFLPVGSHFTMDTEEAVIAAQWLKAKKVIPIHYNTFPAINIDVIDMQEKFQKANIECLALKTGEKIRI